MVRTRRESHHHDGITDPKDLQLPFATKSATSRHRPNDLGWHAPRYFGDLTRNATVVINGQSTGGGAIARKGWTMHERQRAGREIREAADRRAATP
jgi:hypothetical protein